MTLQTVGSGYLQSITIEPHDLPPETVEEEVYQEWHDLDRVLVQFWTSHSIRPRVVYMPRLGEGKDLGVDVPILLPELTRRGLVDLVELPTDSFYVYGRFFSVHVISSVNCISVWTADGREDGHRFMSRASRASCSTTKAAHKWAGWLSLRAGSRGLLVGQLFLRVICGRVGTGWVHCGDIGKHLVPCTVRHLSWESST